MALGTEKAIFDTFEEMLEESSFEKIAVLNLSKRCGISPNTFYYHFEDIYDLLSKWFENKRKDWFKEGDFKGSLEELFHYCKDHKKLIYHIYHSLSRDYLERMVFTYEKETLTNYFKNVPELRKFSKDEIDELTDFVLYGLTGTFIKFMWSDMSEDISTVVNSANNFLEGYIKYFINR